MLELVLFIIPGFASLLVIYKTTTQKNLDITQWILIPLMATYSLLGFALAKLLCFILALLACSPQQLALFNSHLLDTDLQTIELILALFFAMIFANFFNLCKIFSPPSGIEEFLIESKDALIMLILDNGKVYVGHLLAFDTWSKGDLNSIRIIPFLSGIRDPDDKNKLSVHTSYIRIVNDKIQYNDDGGKPIDLTILLNRIISIRTFDLWRFVKYYKNKTIKLDENVKDLADIFDKIYDKNKNN